MLHTPTFTRIKETCLYIASIKATRHFYHDVLGLPVMSEQEGRFVFFRAGDSVLLCFLPEDSRSQNNLPPHHGSGPVHFAFESTREDYVLWKEKVAGAGIPIEHEQEWRKSVWSFYFRDPDNHLVEIITPGLWD